MVYFDDLKIAIILISKVHTMYYLIELCHKNEFLLTFLVGKQWGSIEIISLIFGRDISKNEILTLNTDQN